MSSLWASMADWFTPTSLFIFLNLTILTIFLISHFGSQAKPQQQHYQLARAPSLLQRVRSLNFSHYKFEQTSTDAVTEFLPPDGADPGHPPNELVRSPSLLERLRSLNLSSFRRSDSSVPEIETEPERETTDPSMDLDPAEGEDHEVRRTKSDKGVGALERPQEKMKKSASEKANNVGRRKEATLGYDEEVDAKADDFINRFKQQLRLQRLDSLLRRKGNAQ